MNETPVIDKCFKCGTDYSHLFEYRPGYWICRANACWDEDTERASRRHTQQSRAVEDYRRLVAGTT